MYGFGNARWTGQVIPFCGVGEGRIPTRNTLDWGFKVVETAFLDGRAHLSTKSAGLGCFVNDDDSAGFLHGIDHGVSVPWNKGLQVNEFAIYARIFDRLFAHMDHSTPCKDGASVSFPYDVGFFEGDCVVLFGDLTLRVIVPGWHVVRVAVEGATVATLRFKEDDRVIAFYCAC